MSEIFNTIEITPADPRYYTSPLMPNRLTDLENTPSEPVAMPSKVYLDVTYRCNLTCRHCITASSPYMDVSQELPTEGLLQIVHELKKLNIPEIIVGGGEPFVHPDWAQIFQHIRTLGIRLIITTNGTLLEGDNLQRLKAIAPTEVQVSFDGGRYFHNSIRGHDSYDKAMKGLRNLIQSGLNAVARYTYCNGADTELEDLFRNISATGCKIIQIALLKKAGRAVHEPDLMPLPGDFGLACWLLGLGKKYRLKVYLSQEDFPVDFSDKNHACRTTKHLAGLDTAYISPKGHLWSDIAHPQMPFGQLRTESFETAWQGQKACQFRQRLFKI